MGYQRCDICNRVQHHLLKHCTAHSDWPTASKPRPESEIKIPAYKAEERSKVQYSAPVKSRLKIESGITFDNDRQINKLLNLDPLTAFDTNNLCSFCKGPLDHRTMTEGITKPRKHLIVEEIIINGHVEIVEKIIHVPRKVKACPKCCYLIKPIYNRCIMCKGLLEEEIAQCKYCNGSKEGEMSSQGTKFRETPG